MVTSLACATITRSRIYLWRACLLWNASCWSHASSRFSIRSARSKTNQQTLPTKDCDGWLDGKSVNHCVHKNANVLQLVHFSCLNEQFIHTISCPGGMILVSILKAITLAWNCCRIATSIRINMDSAIVPLLNSTSIFLRAAYTIRLTLSSIILHGWHTAMNPPVIPSNLQNLVIYWDISS
jgi:hypothetical protein